MNWTILQTYNESPERAFETLCNQLFENWSKREYKDFLISFCVVNGSGGDGGVESYSTLIDGKIVGLQAKWFPYSLSDNQIQQIKNSIETAIKIRPQIARYIVCIPRDLASDTGRSTNTETKRWESLLESIKLKYPNLSVELWNETRIVKELQEDSSAGIKKFWFENSEISEEIFSFAFSKSKASWLKTKYVPDLNVYGDIDDRIVSFLGDIGQRRELAESSLKVIALCDKLEKEVLEFIKILKDEDAELKEKLDKMISDIQPLCSACRTIYNWSIEEVLNCGCIESTAFNVDFDTALEYINKNHSTSHHHFHVYEITKLLRKLSSLDIYKIFDAYDSSLCTNPILFLGEPGTGKTHGIAASAEKLFDIGIHTPLVIQARNISTSFNWKDIISFALGLSTNWSEDEIWQAMISMVNRHRLSSVYINSDIKLTPKVLVILDGIDECAPYEIWIERIREANVITKKYPQIRFCFTSRPFVFPNKVSNANIKRIGNAGDVSTHILFDRYMSAYNINAKNYGWLKFALNTPLSLKIFCELNHGKTVEFSKNADISLTNLLRTKIDFIENEFGLKENISVKNQYILRSVLLLSDLFLENKTLERSIVISKFSDNITTYEQHSEKIMQYLEDYGILSSYCKHGDGLNPDLYFYIPGIQGYFDYAMALKLLKAYDHPQNIDFKKCSAIENEALYALAVMSIQNYNYLITRNNTINSAVDEWSIQDLQFFALRHTSHENGLEFKERSLEIMSENADGLITITNNLILPLCRDINHPLGVKLLDEFLFSFQSPAQRDLFWSVPGFLNESEGCKWHTSQLIGLDNDEYVLTKEDAFEGCPSVYVWALSTLNNTLRKEYRSSLMIWAKQNPAQFFELFLKYSDVNDPQIKSDIFSILVCIVYNGADCTIIKKATDWVMENILHPSKVLDNMDVSIRYYSIAIVKKAVLVGLYNDSDILSYMPPYKSDDYSIALDVKALSGTRMGGYSAIEYDLARYVLIDHFESAFCQYGHKHGDQVTDLIDKVAKLQPEFSNIKNEQFIISAAFAYLTKIGWNENEFYNFNKKEQGEGIVGGIDVAITRRYRPATHGSQSSVMTVCEKYIWQFRNYMSGFLSDRLLYWNNYKPESICDYGLLDDFIIPVQDMEQIDPDNLPEDRPWYIPERNIVIIDRECLCKENVIDSVINAPDVNWEQWITIDNTNRQYSVNNDLLLALYNYSCFYGSAGVETCVFVSSIVVNSDKTQGFVDMLCNDEDLSNRVANPVDWRGGIVSSCYITPKEVCWFPWKQRYDSSNVEEFSNFSIQSAVDGCCYNFPEYGDVYYDIPSEPIRKLLGIVDSNGYLFYDDCRRIKAQYSISGEKWRTAQNYLLVDKNELLDALQNCGKSLMWIMREYRREDGKSTEKFGKFYAEKDCSYVGYYKNGNFVVTLFNSKTDHSKNTDF